MAEQPPVPPQSRSTSRQGGGRRAWTWAAVAVVVLLALGAVVRSSKVIERGHLVSYTPSEVERVRLPGGLTILVQPAVRPDVDTINALLLFAVAVVAGFAAFLLWSAAGDPRARARRFHVIAALGAAYLGADELFGIHESIGHNVQFLADLPGIKYPDDVVFAAMAVPAVVFIATFRDLIFGRAGPSPRLFGAAIGLFAAATLLDVADVAVEDFVEILSSAAIFFGFAVVARDDLRAEIGGR